MDIIEKSLLISSSIASIIAVIIALSDFLINKRNNAVVLNCHFLSNNYDHNSDSLYISLFITNKSPNKSVVISSIYIYVFTYKEGWVNTPIHFTSIFNNSDRRLEINSSLQQKLLAHEFYNVANKKESKYIKIVINTQDKVIIKYLPMIDNLNDDYAFSSEFKPQHKNTGTTGKFSLLLQRLIYYKRKKRH